MNSFIFKKDKGEVANSNQVLEWLQSRLKTLPNGVYKVEVKRNVKQRSISQNSLMWLWFTCIAHETGNDKDDIYSLYTSLFLKKEIEIDGNVFEVIQKTSTLNSAKFADFLNRVQVHALSELGITLPNPKDIYFEEFKDTYNRYL